MAIPENYHLVFEDDFNGDRLDLNKWHIIHRKEGIGFVDECQVSLSDGCVHLSGAYKDGPQGPGWYTGDIRTTKRFTRGYFEARLKAAVCLESYQSYWSAFWLQAQHPYEAEISRGGIGGAEIDILEIAVAPDGRPMAETNIHVAGMKNSPANQEKKELDSHLVRRTVMPDADKAFHTYACLWDEDKYAFYIDGVRLAVSAWGDGVSEAGDEVCLSLCLPGVEKMPRDFTCRFDIDYVRVYQKDGDRIE